MLLPSGNDCAYTVAIHLGGTIENFAKMMNDKAKVLGLTSTNFVNPHGLDNENHYTTAKEMAYLTRYALKNPYIDEAVKTKSITINFGSFTKTLNNTNSLLRTYEKADGVKTGFTNGAERCLVSSATDNDRRYICVVLGATTTKIRFNTSKLLLEETFKKYKTMDISNYLKFYININVVKGKIPSYEESINDNMSYPLTNEEYDSIYIKQDIVQSLEAPVAAGTKIGKVEVYLENEKLYEKEIFLKENIYKNNKKIVDSEE